MDFLDPKKKKAHKTRLLIGYGLVGVMIALFSLILLFYSYGYNIDSKTGEVIQNGLIFLDSRPNGASITINDKKYEPKTDARIFLPSGNYNIELQLSKYRPWKKSVELDGGEVERFAFPLLIPEKVNVSELSPIFALPKNAMQSPDGRWLVTDTTNPGVFVIYDLENVGTPAGTVSITLPEDMFSAFSGEQTYKVIDWSEDNRRFLVEHSGGGQQEFAVIDREQPLTSFNINKTFLLNPSKVTLKNKQYNQYYFHYSSTGLLQEARVENRQVNNIETSVKEYKSHGNDILLLAKQAQNEAAKVIIIEKGKQYVLREVAAGSYFLDLAQYSGSWYYAAGSSTDGKIYIYKDPLKLMQRQAVLTPAPIALLRTENAGKISFSKNTRFLALQGGQKFVVYDFEYNQPYKFEIKDDLGGKPVEWMDGHRFAFTAGGQIQIIEYDGGNNQQLAAGENGAPIFFDKNFENCFYFASSSSVSEQKVFARCTLIAD